VLSAFSIIFDDNEVESNLTEEGKDASDNIDGEREMINSEAIERVGEIEKTASTSTETIPAAVVGRWWWCWRRKSHFSRYNIE